MVMFCERNDFVSSHLALALSNLPRESSFFVIPLLRRHNNLTLVCFSDEKNIKHCREEFYVVCCAFPLSLTSAMLLQHELYAS